VIQVHSRGYNNRFGKIGEFKMADNETSKEIAVHFLQLAIEGKIKEAYLQYVDMSGKHHNPYFPAGFPALEKAMIEDHAQSPDKQISFVNVLGEGDRVAVLSHLRRGADEMMVVHFFRFKKNKIVELWDCGQILPADSPNEEGAF
jgi:predicted SnoaL-like aldol condensation-catalyzing enzyme